MKYFLYTTLLILLLTIETKATDKCLETTKVDIPGEKGLALKAIERVQNDGWFPVKGKRVVQDLDQNGKDDFAFLLKKNNQLRVYVIWDGDRVMEAQCHSELVEPTPISQFTDDPCKLKFEPFKEKSESGLLIRTHETFTYKYLCRKFSKADSSRLWNNIGTSD